MSIALAVARDLDRDLNRSCARGVDLVKILRDARSRNLTRDRDYSRVRDLVRDAHTIHNLVVALVCILENDRGLDNDRGPALVAALRRACDLVRKLDKTVDLGLDLIKALLVDQDVNRHRCRVHDLIREISHSSDEARDLARTVTEAYENVSQTLARSYSVSDLDRLVTPQDGFAAWVIASNARTARAAVLLLLPIVASLFTSNHIVQIATLGGSALGTLGIAAKRRIQAEGTRPRGGRRRGSRRS